MPNVSPAFAVNFFCLSASLPSIETASVAESLPNLVLAPSIVIVVVPLEVCVNLPSTCSGLPLPLASVSVFR